MSAYGVFEAVVITAALVFSLRVLWQRVLAPALRRPKAACGSGCSQCGTDTAAGHKLR